jgi:hypothetical protein
MRNSRIFLGLCGALAIALASQVTYAGRCDGNQGNGNGNICTPVTPPETPAQGETDREYTARVHTYAHGNSIAIQHLDKRQEATEATVVTQGNRQEATEATVITQGNRLEGHDRELASQGNRLEGHDRELASQGTRLEGHDRELASQGKAISSTQKVVKAQGEVLDSQGKAISSTQKVVKAQGEVLDSNSDILASHGAAIHAQANYSAGNRAMISSLYDRANDHESRISSLERRMDELNEANAIALAVAGHQFNTQVGFQTAVSVSTMNGKQALAIGAGGAINERLFINAGVAQSGSTSGGVVSSTLAW